MINITTASESRVLSGSMYDKSILLITYLKTDFEEIKCTYWHKHEIATNNWHHLKSTVLHVFKNAGRMHMLLSRFLNIFTDKWSYMYIRDESKIPGYVSRWIFAICLTQVIYKSGSSEESDSSKKSDSS